VRNSQDGERSCLKSSASCKRVYQNRGSRLLHGVEPRCLVPIDDEHEEDRLIDRLSELIAELDPIPSSVIARARIAYQSTQSHLYIRNTRFTP
jgi:hypothetical protein